MVLIFNGTDPTLKPIVLFAPDEDPSGLQIGLLQTIQMYVKEKVRSRRTIILGFEDADSMGKFLSNKFGKNSIYLVLAPGLPAYTELFGTNFILGATSEKGRVDLEVEATTQSLDSSHPMDHSSIGIVSSFINYYERHTFEPLLTKGHPLIECAQCLAKYSSEFSSKDQVLLTSAKKSALGRKNLARMFHSKNETRFWTTTSQSVNVITGGTDVDLIPGKTNAKINHRLAHGNALDTVLTKASRWGKQVAIDYGVGFVLNGEQVVRSTEKGTLNITSYNSVPCSPYTPLDDVWNVWAGSMRSLYEDYVYPEEYTLKSLPVSPIEYTLSADTHGLWDLTDRIYRAQPGELHNATASRLQTVAFYYSFLQTI